MNELKTDYHLTDTGNAERFAADHRDTVRYCRPWKRWFYWDGTRWKPDETGKPDEDAPPDDRQ